MTEFKKGDIVGLGKMSGVVSENNNLTYPIRVDWDGCGDWTMFTLYGRLDDCHPHPSLELIERPKKKVEKQIIRWFPEEDLFKDHCPSVRCSELAPPNRPKRYIPATLTYEVEE